MDMNKFCLFSLQSSQQYNYKVKSLLKLLRHKDQMAVVRYVEGCLSFSADSFSASVSEHDMNFDLGFELRTGEGVDDYDFS